MSSYLEELNDRQRKAATHKDGPLLIVAGAGAGKTRTIAYRILHLIKSGVPAEQILAITFTNKAAKELKERVQSLMKKNDVFSFYGGEPTVCTFHSLGVNILREHAQKLSLSRWFTILDRDESLSIIKRALKNAGYDPKEEDPKKYLNAISREKSRMNSRDSYEKDARGYFGEILLKVWAAYEKTLKEAGSLDFDDLIVRPVELLQKNPEVRQLYEKRFPYLHIDEYQDTNTAQFEFARLLAENHGNICVVGDTDQGIYGWREADYRNLLNFETQYKNATVVLLEENYRSTQRILSAANAVISQNTLRKEKNLFTKGKEGDKIVLYGAIDGQGEARYVAKTCERLIKNGGKGSEIAVLYRANFLSRTFEEAFLSLGIPYHLVGTTFYERKEVKDTLAYVRAAMNADDLMSFARIANTPRRGIGAATLDAVLSSKETDLNNAAREKLSGVRRILSKIREQAELVTPSLLIRYTLKESGLEKELMENEDDEDRLGNAHELATLAARYDALPIPTGLEQFLMDTALLSDQDSLTEAKDGVRLMTVHASKGLEFRNVFVVGLEEGIFPSRRRGDDRDETEASEEERRLFYVAITRAKENLTLSYASTRMVYGSTQFSLPSEFIADIPNDLLEKEGGAKSNGLRLSSDPVYVEEDDGVEWDVLKILRKGR